MFNWVMVRGDATAISGQADDRLSFYRGALEAWRNPFYTRRGRCPFVRIFIAEEDMPLESYDVRRLPGLIEEEEAEEYGKDLLRRQRACCEGHAAGDALDNPCRTING